MNPPNNNRANYNFQPSNLPIAPLKPQLSMPHQPNSSAMKRASIPSTQYFQPNTFTPNAVAPSPMSMNQQSSNQYQPQNLSMPPSNSYSKLPQPTVNPDMFQHQRRVSMPSNNFPTTMMSSSFPNISSKPMTSMDNYPMPNQPGVIPSYVSTRPTIQGQNYLPTQQQLGQNQSYLPSQPLAYNQTSATNLALPQGQGQMHQPQGPQLPLYQSSYPTASKPPQYPQNYFR